MKRNCRCILALSAAALFSCTASGTGGGTSPEPSSLSSPSSSHSSSSPLECPSASIELLEKDPATEFPKSTYRYAPGSSTLGLTYSLSEDKTYYSVSNKNHGLSTPNLVIPSTHEGLPVKEIEAEAFTELTWLESVTIPSSISKIGDGAFSQTGLKRVYFDAEEAQDFNARNWVFYSSEQKETEVYIGPHVKRIPANFMRPLSTDPKVARKVTKLEIDSSSSLLSIGTYAFYGNEGLKSVAFPASLRQIEESAFEGCGMGKADLSSCVKIAAKAFFQCPNLQAVAWGEGLQELGSYAFAGTSLSQADLELCPLKEIPDHAFASCSSLKKLYLPSSCLSLGESAFENSALERFDSWNLTSIGEDCFRGAPLRQIWLRESLSLGQKAFSGNLGEVEKLVISSDLADLEAGNGVFSGLLCQEAVFAKGVTTIPSRLFFPTQNAAQAPRLETIHLPSTLSRIGQNAFFGAQVGKAFLWGEKNRLDGGEGNQSVLEAMEEVRA